MIDPRIADDELPPFERMLMLWQSSDQKADARLADIKRHFDTVVQDFGDERRERDRRLEDQFDRLWDAVEGVGALVREDSAGIKKELADLNDRHGRQIQELSNRIVEIETTVERLDAASKKDRAGLHQKLDESQADRAGIHQEIAALAKEIEAIRAKLGAD